VTHTWEKRNAFRVLVGKPEAKRPTGTPGLRWENNNKMDLKGICWEVLDQIYLAQDGTSGRFL
jgi:hypothetical protein